MDEVLVVSKEKGYGDNIESGVAGAKVLYINAKE